MKAQEPTLKQIQIRNELGERYNIDPERILFLNKDKPEEPWLPAEALMTIARQSGNFQAIDETFTQFIEPLKQIVHSATVIDKDGRSYARCGVATLGERDDVDEHALAAGRALNAALTAAGYNPLRPGSAVTLDLNLSKEAHAATDEARSRTVDIKRIHALATQKGLIQNLPSGAKEVGPYRKMLKEQFGISTVVNAGPEQRASIINYLEHLPNADDLAEEEFAAEEELVGAN